MPILHSKETSVNFNNVQIILPDEILEFLELPSNGVPWPFKGNAAAPPQRRLCGSYEVS